MSKNLSAMPHLLLFDLAKRHFVKAKIYISNLYAKFFFDFGCFVLNTLVALVQIRFRALESKIAKSFKVQEPYILKISSQHTYLAI
jgi:hypothetical protein